MHNILSWFSRLVTARPWITILVLILITVGLGAGATQRLPPPETVDTLPKGSAVAETLVEIDELFSDVAGKARVVTLIFRGDALTPTGLAEMDALIGAIDSEPGVMEMLSPDNPIIAPSTLVKSVLQVENLEGITQAEIDFVRSVPQVGPILDAMTGTDNEGVPVSIGTVSLLDTGDERLAAAERKINQLTTGHQGSLRASSSSFVVIEDEYKKATAEGMGLLVGVAFLLIAALILVFMRTVSDLLLTLSGLLMSIIWIVGAEGWLGPKGAGLVGPPNSLTVMVPIIVIGLTVDYAIQSVSHYREQRAAGEPVLGAVRIGLRNVMVPLLLAAVTTVVSLLANLFSPVEIVGDFGIIAGLGVGMSLIVMLTLLPAARTIIDRRREARGTLRTPRPIATALPGVPSLAELWGRQVTRRPAPYLLAVLLVSGALGYAATGLESEFSINDILPRDGKVLEDITTLEEAVGGSPELASVLIKAEATETRTFLNMGDLTTAFEDEERRPKAAAGPIQASYWLLIHDWTEDSGTPGDKYDPELAALFREASAGERLDPALTQELLDRIEERDPSLARVLVNNPDGTDAMLVQFPAYAGDRTASKLLQGDIEDLWLGDDSNVTVTSVSIISVTVTDAVTEGQTEAITTTILSALAVLALFFWLTVRQPALAIIAVGPIVLVLISVLGTMALLNIPYTIITSIIAALSIGIGVDYTIHMIHRYREEYTQIRDPEVAAIRTLATTGSALLGSALTTALGLGVLIASPLAASQQFGFTAAITIAYSLIFSLVVVPPAMTVWGAYQNMRLRATIKRWEEEMDLEIEAVYRRHEQEEATS